MFFYLQLQEANRRYERGLGDGVRGASPPGKFSPPHPFILGKHPFGYKDTSYSRWKRPVALAISMLSSKGSILLQI